ncbi:hypothetical protein BHM03_00028101, partial [Ensete ventricosum]
MGSDEEVDDLMGVVAAVTVITEEDDVGSGEGIKVDDSLKVELEGTQLGCCKGRRGGIVTDRPTTLGNLGYRYVDRPLPDSSAKNQSLAVDFDHRRPIEEEIDRQRSIEEEIDCRRSIEQEKGKRKKKKKKKKKKKRKRRKKEKRRRRKNTKCLRAVAARGSQALFLPRGEKDRGD